jgi:hypothetical protein
MLNSKRTKKITYPEKTIKFAELLMITISMLLLVSLLSGCNTTQTLGAQFGMSELPTKVARKLYGTCGQCNLDVNCPLCKATQNYNRKLAAAPSSQKAQFPIAGTSFQAHQGMLENLQSQSYDNNYYSGGYSNPRDYNYAYSY